MEKKKEHPRVLVISHNCFSQSGSNGRTLANFFIDWPRESVAQFYNSNEISDSPVCDNYFRVLDTEALTAFYKGSRVGRVVNRETQIADLKDDDASLDALYRRHRKRKSFNYIARNFIWDSKRWRGQEFEKWIDDFDPEVVLLQLGDYAFMLRIALEIAKKRNIPLVIYNTEDYYFKDRQSLSPLYNYYRRDYKRQVRKLLSYASHSIYNSDMLQETYKKEFQQKSTVIMTATEMIPAVEKSVNTPLVVSYLGNLGVGRHEPLIEIAEALREVDPDIYLDIYGKIPNKDIEKALHACTGIRLKGFVSYDEVIRVMKHSDLLVHAENSSEFYQWDLKHAFSTKIADCLASGTCMFMYGPGRILSIKYLQDNNAACVVTEKEQLKMTLKKIISDKVIRGSYVEKALKLARIKHDAETNSKRFEELIREVVSENEEVES